MLGRIMDRLACISLTVLGLGAPLGCRHDVALAVDAGTHEEDPCNEVFRAASRQAAKDTGCDALSPPAAPGPRIIAITGDHGTTR